VVERENAHARKKRKTSDSRFLNPNEPFGLGSIFNRGRKLVFGNGSIPPEAKNTFWPRFNFNRGKKQFLAAVQFQPRPNVTAIMAFLKY